ncbi:PilZ domain-containing protein [Alteromonas lipolytica]|uniref:Pilus assembly protein PilZ n=1 Tax=Alteromonas lipolytica TaxID=1856405 RepID=A0A1E8FA82_9ALTE|nr:PilZ domain-containing protein [Alteromonas lipolytica]OFI32508.1 pilus assembly protein PilZ [Alteromonas lipolytica]GGF75628.1 pilus assembly protein PilZ [Alteromonas lipolytica]
MNQDLSQYATIIEQLKPMVKEPEFNQVLQQVASHVPKEKRFLIKMEVKRLARPCMRAIDLRGQVDGECKLYEFDGIKHYLDDVAIEVFEQQVRVFGLYCFGVYEAVMATENNFRVIREKAEARNEQDTEIPEKASNSLTQFDVPNISLLTYAKRVEERMNFAVALEIFTETNNSIRATSVDISTKGMKIKLSKEQLFKPGENIGVYFRGLETEYSLDKKLAIKYQVVSISRKKEYQFLQMKRLADAPNSHFDQFIDKFIHGNKRRYKVNMDNTIDAIINKSCEQYFSPSCPSLPVYIEVNEGRARPRFAMANDINRHILSYWNDEEDELRLGYLITGERLKQLIQSPHESPALYVYTFNHIQNGKVYFYSASSDELARHPALKDLFIGFGSRKVSWRVFKLAIGKMSPRQAYAPLSLPDDVGSKVKRQNAKPAPRLMARLQNLAYIVQVTDITSDREQLQYSQIKIDRNQLKALKLFGHARNRPPGEIKAFRYKFQEQRMETRYLLRTSIQVVARGQTISAISEDISINGMRLEIDGEYHGDLNMRVLVSLPKLQELTSKYDLNNLHYRVVHISGDKNVLHLRSVAGDDGLPARRFFTELIKNNKSSLKTYPDEEEIPGIGHALRCINAKNPSTLAFVLSKVSGRYLPQVGVLSKQANPRLKTLFSHFAEQQKMNLEIFFRDRHQDAPFIQQAIKQVKTEHQPISKEIFVAFRPAEKNPAEAIDARYEHRFNSDDSRRQYIENALSNGQFIAMAITVSTTGKPDLEMLQSEINYIGVYAIHRAKELEERLWSIGASVHAVDITDQVLLRFGFDEQRIAQNHKAPSQHAIEPGGIKALLKS